MRTAIKLARSKIRRGQKQTGQNVLDQAVGWLMQLIERAADCSRDGLTGSADRDRDPVHVRKPAASCMTVSLLGKQFFVGIPKRLLLREQVRIMQSNIVQDCTTLSLGTRKNQRSPYRGGDQGHLSANIRLALI